VSDIERAAAKRDQPVRVLAIEERARHELLVESLGDARRGNVLVLLAIALCVAIPGLLFALLGPGNGFTELGVALVFAVAALALAVALPAYLQRRFAAQKLAALRALRGLDVDRYAELLGRPRDGGRLVANVEFGAAPTAEQRARLEHRLAGWHVEWDGATLMAETEPLSGKLVLDSAFKSSGAPREAFTNAAFHARLEALVAALEMPATSIVVDIAS
jgi:hypothetical protein